MSVPQRRGQDSTDAARLISALSQHSGALEAYRVLRTNLRFVSVDRPVRTITITSALPGDGKTLTTANLGIALAMDGVRVALVDADLRHPMLHRLLGVQRGCGLTSVLTREATLDEALTFTPLENLSVLPAGPVPPNPTELVSTQALANLHEELLGRVDMVLMDTPPVLAAADAALTAARCDGVLLVVRAGVTDRRLALRAREALENVHARVLGAVLSGVQEGDAYGYYYGYYGHAGHDGGKARRIQ
jgi:capsular exopolysaccharide synthesis family protein